MRKRRFWRGLLSLLLASVLFVGCGVVPGEEGASRESCVSRGDSTFCWDGVSLGDMAPPVSSRVIIALLDTGVSAEAIGSENLLAGCNYVTDSGGTEDLINHGTAVASLILGCESAGVEGAAPEAEVVPLVVVTRKEGETVSASPELLAEAIRDSVDIYHADIINVSLGVRKDAPALKAAVEYAEEKGVLVVSAVGNDGPGAKPWYPAAYETVLAAGSCDRQGERSDFTQDGADVLARGEDLPLASRNGAAYRARGTSFAAGLVSAEAAGLLAADPSLTPEELRESIRTEKSNSPKSITPRE